MFQKLIDLHRSLIESPGPRDQRRHARPSADSSYTIEGGRGNRWRPLVAVGMATILVVGCGGDTAAPVAGQGLVRVAAASDLADALPLIVKRYEATRAIRVETLFGSSGQLARQIENGAPVDLFLSADRGFVESLAAKGLIDPATVKPYAIGSLALIARTELASQIISLSDLERPEFARIAIANPDHAPYGRAAREALISAGLWERLQPRLVLADTIRQAVQFVDSGNADAGLVSHSLVLNREPAGVAVDESLHKPLTQALGVVVGSTNRAETQAFADHLLSEEARAILRQNGLRPADRQPTAAP